jgi:hypothetical protein
MRSAGRSTPPTSVEPFEYRSSSSASLQHHLSRTRGWLGVRVRRGTYLAQRSERAQPYIENARAGGWRWAGSPLVFLTLPLAQRQNHRLEVRDRYASTNRSASQWRHQRRVDERCRGRTRSRCGSPYPGDGRGKRSHRTPRHVRTRADDGKGYEVRSAQAGRRSRETCTSVTAYQIQNWS